ncbi:MAG TPA: dihydrodipicolinate synthase family protein [Clostridiales bacterium]|nr:dihydrodipicolinate synthase family protein [Clostridiales bacterium]
MINVKFKGIMPAIISPVNEDGSIREKELRRLINWQLAAGCSGFYICGATGEGTVMKPEARKAMAEIAVDEVKGRGCIIDHIGAIDLKTAADLARHASDIGVDAISSVPPFFYTYGENEIMNYYQAVSDASDVPILMYASPLAGTNITAEIVEKMLSIKNMIGLKWTSYNYYEMRKIKELNNSDINVINGPDETLLCGLAMGADGGIGATYNPMPKIFVDIYNNFTEGKIDEAQKAQFKANKVIRILLKYGVLCGVKDMLDMLGFDVGYCTYPLKRFTPSEQEAFRAELKAINFVEKYLHNYVDNHADNYVDN